MGRLIDADVLYEKLKKDSSYDLDFFDSELIEVIEAIPTAYNVDAVVAELEDAVESYCSDYHGVDYIEPDRAIDIVKRGGVE